METTANFFDNLAFSTKISFFSVEIFHYYFSFYVLPFRPVTVTMFIYCVQNNICEFSTSRQITGLQKSIVLLEKENTVPKLRWLSACGYVVI